MKVREMNKNKYILQWLLVFLWSVSGWVPLFFVIVFKCQTGGDDLILT